MRRKTLLRCYASTCTPFVSKKAPCSGAFADIFDDVRFEYAHFHHRKMRSITTKYSKLTWHFSDALHQGLSIYCPGTNAGTIDFPTWTTAARYINIHELYKCNTFEHLVVCLLFTSHRMMQQMHWRQYAERCMKYQVRYLYNYIHVLSAECGASHRAVTFFVPHHGNTYIEFDICLEWTSKANHHRPKSLVTFPTIGTTSRYLRYAVLSISLRTMIVKFVIFHLDWTMSWYELWHHLHKK